MNKKYIFTILMIVLLLVLYIFRYVIFYEIMTFMRDRNCEQGAYAYNISEKKCLYKYHFSEPECLSRGGEFWIGYRGGPEGGVGPMDVPPFCEIQIN